MFIYVIIYVHPFCRDDSSITLAKKGGTVIVQHTVGLFVACLQKIAPSTMVHWLVVWNMAFYSSIYWDFMGFSSSHLTNSMIFQRGRYTNHQPVQIQIFSRKMLTLPEKLQTAPALLPMLVEGQKFIDLQDEFSAPWLMPWWAVMTPWAWWNPEGSGFWGTGW